jgi:Flp pilus assembly protein TadG
MTAFRQRLARFLGRTARDRQGVAAVEFALIAPVLLVMLAGVIDFSLYIGTRIELEQALRAGAQYALKDFTDSTTISAAVTGATNLSSVTVSYDPATDSYCECPDGTSNACPGNASYSACSTGERPGLFVTLVGSATYDPMFTDLPGLSSNMTVTQQVTMRVR